MADGLGYMRCEATVHTRAWFVCATECRTGDEHRECRASTWANAEPIRWHLFNSYIFRLIREPKDDIFEAGWRRRRRDRMQNRKRRNGKQRRRNINSTYHLAALVSLPRPILSSQIICQADRMIYVCLSVLGWKPPRILSNSLSHGNDITVGTCFFPLRRRTLKKTDNGFRTEIKRPCVDLQLLQHCALTTLSLISFLFVRF